LSFPAKGSEVQMTQQVLRPWSEIKENLRKESRFLVLRIFAGLTVLCGFCLMLPGIIAAVLIIDNGANLNSPPTVLAGLAVAACAVLLGIPLIAFGELIQCIVQIERNTAATAHNTKIIAEKDKN